MSLTAVNTAEPLTTTSQVVHLGLCSYLTRSLASFESISCPNRVKMSDSLLEYGSHWYGSQFPVDHDHEAAPAFSTNESMTIPLAAFGAQDVWNGEQQCRGLAAAPSTSTHSHRQDVGGSADPSAVASTSTAVPGLDGPVLPEAPTSRKRKAKKTSNAQTEDVKSKKPKSTSYKCPYEGCSYGERTAARRHELSSCVSRRSE